MFRMASAFLILALTASAALAQTTAVQVPVGNWTVATLAFIRDSIPAIVAGVVAWGFRFLPEQIVAILKGMRVEQIISRGIDYGINAVVGAVRGKTLSVDVANEVIAEALQYILDRIPGALLSWIGGPDKLKGMIAARLNVEPDAALKV